MHQRGLSGAACDEREEGEEKKHAAHHLDVIAKGSNHEGDKWV